MTLFTAEGMLLAGNKIDNANYISSIREMCQCWYLTQSEVYPVQDEKHCSRLMRVPELFHRRCPGTTCMTAIKAGANGTVNVPINDSKGCGGVMRVAPIGLYFCGTSVPYEKSDRLGAEAAALTHGHDLGFIPAAVLVHIVRAVTESDILLKDAVSDSVKAVKKLFPLSKHLSEFVTVMQKAVSLAETDTDDLSAIHQLGEGCVAEETLAIAVYCALKYENDFDKALRAAVNHNGDSDSTGAVCGNILGAYLGYNAIPQKYKEHLELHNQIMETAAQLCNLLITRLHFSGIGVTPNFITGVNILPGIMQCYPLMLFDQIQETDTEEVKGTVVMAGQCVQVTFTKTGSQYHVKVACEGKGTLEFTNTLYPEDATELDEDTFDVACAIVNIVKKQKI